MSERTVRVANREAGKHIVARHPFTGHNLSAQIYQLGSVPTGRLGPVHVATLRADAATGPVYVVFSYATPIAWWAAETGWTVPDARYSPTTSRHQHIVRDAI